MSDLTPGTYDANPNDPAFRGWLRNILRDPECHNVCVSFTKKDGTQRDMMCTLVEARVPFDKRPKTNLAEQVENEKSEDEKKDGSTAQSVFDMEIGEWRSFRWDSIVNVTFNSSREADA